MKRKLLSMLVGISVALLSVIALPAYAGGGSHGGGGGHGGFSGGARGAGMARGYSGAGISRGTGSYGSRQYSSGISTGRYGSYRGYGQRYYAPRSSTGGRVYGSSARSQSRTVLPDNLLGRHATPVVTTSHEINPGLALRANPES